MRCVAARLRAYLRSAAGLVETRPGEGMFVAQNIDPFVTAGNISHLI